MTSRIKQLFSSLLLCLALVHPGYSQDTTAVDSSGAVKPGKAMLYSFIPGGGQLYNKRPLKALLFAGVFTYYSYELVLAQDSFNGDPTSSDLHRKRNDKIWMMGLTWTLNIIDAYIDAQFWDFDKYELDDSVLPDSKYVKPKEMEDIDDTD